MKMILLDTNVVSILFKADHSHYSECYEAVAGYQRCISFMTRAELNYWPIASNWGARRRDELREHIDLCTTLLPDEKTCALWADVVAESKAKGRTMSVPDVWVAASARQWDLALVTADYDDFEHLSDLQIIPIVM